MAVGRIEQNYHSKRIHEKRDRKDMKKTTKKAMTFLLAASMIATSFPAFNATVHAAELPDSSQFATVEKLKTFNTDDTDGEKNPAKVYFGNNDQQWWIAGSQSNDSITLFAARPLATNQLFESGSSNKPYDSSWNCTYPNGSPADVYPNHYGASPLRNTLKGLESSYFTIAEQSLMKDTTIYTSDTKNGSVYSTTNKLYLAHGADGDTYIAVGKNSTGFLNSGLRVDTDYWGIGDNRTFYLRAPYSGRENASLNTRNVDSKVSWSAVYYKYALVPAFELNLSSVLFASSTPLASIDGNLKLNDVFTLRCNSQTSIGTATIGKSKQSVGVTGVTNESTYLVVQNKDGAWSKKVSGNDVVFVNEMSNTLTSFENCQIWLETTDSKQRMTYAAMAAQGNNYNIKINVGDTMTASTGNVVQTNVAGSIDKIVINAQNDYMFPADYAIPEQDGITVTRDSENQISISGTPTADINMTLTPATAKNYSMILDVNGTFAETCVGYEPIAANEFTITNTGNVDLRNISVSITGNDADKFELVWDNTSTINPNGKLKITV